MTHSLFNSVKKNNSLILRQYVSIITVVRPGSTLIFILITSLYAFVCPTPKLLAYVDNTGFANGHIDRTISTTQIKEYFISESIPSPVALIPSSNSYRANIANTSQNSSADNAESIIGSFLNPKILLGSAINQIRNSTSSGENNFEIRNSTLSLFGNYKILLLSRQIIPPKNYILLFDAEPSEISNSQIAAKLPCDANYTSPLKLFVLESSSGLKIQTRLIDLHVIGDLSKPGYTCLYKATIPNSASTTLHSIISNSVKNNTNSTDSGLIPEQTINSVGLLNPTNYQQVLPPTSSILWFN